MEKQKAKINVRRKGHRFERLIADNFRRWFPDARRGLQYQEGEHCPDVVETPFYIECKRYGERLPAAIETLYQKAYNKMMLWRDQDGGRDSAVLLIYKLDRKPVMVAMARSVCRELGLSGSCGRTWEEFAKALDKIYPVKEEV